MSKSNTPIAIRATEAPARAKQSNYPEPFNRRMARRMKQPLGEVFGLQNFGVNFTTIAPGGMSALMHSHKKADELVYVLDGNPTLVTESVETVLEPGMCAGFCAGGEAHHLVNRSDSDVQILEIGDRTSGDEVRYPLDDLRVGLGSDGNWGFTHADGKPY